MEIDDSLEVVNEETNRRELFSDLLEDLGVTALCVIKSWAIHNRKVRIANTGFHDLTSLRTCHRQHHKLISRVFLLVSHLHDFNLCPSSTFWPVSLLIKKDFPAPVKPITSTMV